MVVGQQGRLQGKGRGAEAAGCDWRKAPDRGIPRPIALRRWLRPGSCVRNDSPIRLLTFSTLFPHAARPNHGIFVENRLRHLLASGQATSIVLAPVPWFPSQSQRFGDWALNARAPATETRHGIEVRHPRYPVIPQVGHVRRALAAVSGNGASRRAPAGGGPPLRCHRRALRLSGRRRGHLAGPALRTAGGDDRPRHRRESDPPLSPSHAA